MGKHIAKLGTLCVVGALAFAQVAGASYKPPKPKGGGATTKSVTRGVGKQLQNKTGNQIAKGISVHVHFPKAGKITCTIKHGSTVLAEGSVSSKTKGVKKTLKIKFNAAGKAFVKSHAGSTVTVICTFKPTHGKTVTSTATAKLG